MSQLVLKTSFKGKGKKRRYWSSPIWKEWVKHQKKTVKDYAEMKLSSPCFTMRMVCTKVRCWFCATLSWSITCYPYKINVQRGKTSISSLSRGVYKLHREKKAAVSVMLTL